MAEEIRLAFEMPEARSAALGNNLLDRIAVRDYIKEVEIGAFQSERGVRQRVLFNIVLEVSSNVAAQFDDVDQVLSYDTIIEAIEDQLAFERLNLLETLAERICEQVLRNSRAVRIFVRIEKLDRIPGSLGIEIVRSRDIQNSIKIIDKNPVQVVAAIHPLVVFMPNSVLNSDKVIIWLDAIAGHSQPAIICLEQTEQTPPVSAVEAANNRIALLCIEQNAWVLAGMDKRCVVVDSRTELDWAIKNDQLSIWAPSKMVLDAVIKPTMGAEDPLGLAQWFATEFSADNVSVLQGFKGIESSDRLQIITDIAQL